MSGRAPEDLAHLLEDALVLRDAAGAGDLFERDAVIANASGQRFVAELGDAIGELRFWSEPVRIVRARRTALVVGSSCMSVLHLSCDGEWRYAICLLDHDDPPDPVES